MADSEIVVENLTKDYPRVSQVYLSALTTGEQIPVYVLGQSEENGELQLSLSKGLENQVWEGPLLGSP